MDGWMGAHSREEVLRSCSAMSLLHSGHVLFSCGGAVVEVEEVVVMERLKR